MLPLLYGSFCVILLSTLVIILTPVFRSKDFTVRQRYLMAGSVFVFFFTIMFSVYYGVGAPEVVTLNMEREQRMVKLTQTIRVLSQRVKDSPEDVDAWVGLGDSFMQTGQYKGAVGAYKEAVKLTGGNPKVILAYAQAQVSDANGTVTDPAKKALEIVLLQEPKNADARYLMAVRTLQDGDAPSAMKEFRDIYYHLPEGSPLKDHIDRQIGNK